MSRLLVRKMIQKPIYQPWSEGEYLKFESGRFVVGLIELPTIKHSLSRKDIDRIISEHKDSWVALSKNEAIHLLASYRHPQFGHSIVSDPEHDIERLMKGADHAIEIRDHIPQTCGFVNWGMSILGDPNPKERDSLGRLMVNKNPGVM